LASTVKRVSPQLPAPRIRYGSAILITVHVLVIYVLTVRGRETRAEYAGRVAALPSDGEVAGMAGEVLFGGVHHVDVLGEEATFPALRANCTA
jgi:hypothetical protein